MAAVKDDTFTKAQAVKSSMGGRVLATALAAEALGTFVFQFFGGRSRVTRVTSLRCFAF